MTSRGDAFDGPAWTARRDQVGSALVEFVWLGILLLVPMIWILLSVFEVQRGAFATTAAARAAGRAYSLAPDQTSALAHAERAARFILDEQGNDDMPMRLEVACSQGPERCLAPSSTVTVRVRSGVRLPFLPAFFSAGETDFALDATHSVPIGHYTERRE